MAVTVYIPPPFRRATDNRGRLPAAAERVGALLDELRGNFSGRQGLPRDATRAYYVDGADQRKMYDLMDKGFELSVIYHSHPDTDAYFSPTDKDQAAPPPTREPVWPGITYVVLSVRKGCAAECAAFRWADATGDFVEVHRAPAGGSGRV